MALELGESGLWLLEAGNRVITRTDTGKGKCCFSALGGRQGEKR